MSSQAESPLVELPIAPLAAARRRFAWEGLLEAAGDLLNPILVKEARQALKSRQFLITFTLLLIGSWGITIVGVAFIGPSISYGAQGPTMFFMYYLMMAFAVLVIVPFSAFRSLAAEHDDRTHELLSITTLSARQIVRGKLGSAVVQMLVYLSAITPCLAFTYMLRGIDVPTILFILFYTVLGSLGLSMAALLLGALTSEKLRQTVLSVMIVVGLLIAFWIGCMFAGGMLSTSQIPVTEPWFWQSNAAGVSGYLGYFLLCFYAAAAQITFSSDNRSTRLRVIMLAQQLLFAGWMFWLFAGPAGREYETFIVYIGFLALHWYTMGALMTGESPELSLRVKRRLPQSFLGRVFLTWFNPGPATGYVLAVSSLLAALLTVFATLVALDWLRLRWFRLPSGSRPGMPSGSQVLAFGVLAVCYLTIYLGVGLLLVRLVRKFVRGGILLAPLLQVLLLLLGILVPFVVEGFSPRMQYADYTPLHITNPFYSSTHLVYHPGRLPPDAVELLTFVPLAALIVFLLNLPAIAREVRHVRIEQPSRVAAEDAELLAAKHPPQPVHISPWD